MFFDIVRHRIKFFTIHDGVKSDGSAKGNVKYLQSLSYRNIKDSDSLENCVEICAH